MKRYARGLTLLELMTALTVVGVLMALAVPGFRQFTINSRTTAGINEVVTSLNLARSEALRRATPTIVCASADAATCSGANDWSTGWIVFSDRNGNGTPQPAELLQVWPALDGGLAALANQPQAVYNAMGMGQPPVGGANFTVRVGHAECTGDRVGQTVVNLAGTVQTARIACPIAAP